MNQFPLTVPKEIHSRVTGSAPGSGGPSDSVGRESCSFGKCSPSRLLTQSKVGEKPWSSMAKAPQLCEPTPIYADERVEIKIVVSAKITE